MTLEELSEKCQNGTLKGTMWIDNDQITFVSPHGDDDYQRLYDAHPGEALEEALDLLGIPHESV